MTEKEKRIQGALGTMQRQMFIQADWKDMNGLIEGFEEALENFGLFMYDHPDMEGGDEYAFIISNEQLTDEQIAKLCGCDEEDDDGFIDGDACNGCEFEDKNICSVAKGCAKSRKTLNK